MSETITFNPISAKSFERMYQDAVKENKEIFVFQGKEFLTTYAKYVVQYLQMQKLLPEQK